MIIVVQRFRKIDKTPIKVAMNIDSMPGTLENKCRFVIDLVKQWDIRTGLECDNYETNKDPKYL
mgnify:CR=1